MTEIRRVEQGRLRVQLRCDDPSLAIQSAKDETDVNRIVARFEKTGLLPQVDVIGDYLDVSEAGDYRSALDRIRDVDRVFQQLPAAARAKFDNDPALFIDQVGLLPLAELEELGLAERIVPLVQARNDETGRFEAGKEPADEVEKRSAAKS